MNFIDRALANKEKGGGDDFLQAMADIYSEPEVWEHLGEYPSYVGDVIYIIDYDTQIQMEGLESIFYHPEEGYYEKIRDALINCGAEGEAKVLEQYKELLKARDASEEDSFEEELDELETHIACRNDYDKFWELVTDYIERAE